MAVPVVTFSVLFGRVVTNVILVAALNCVGCMMPIHGLSHCCVVVGDAMQVRLVVTRLTVVRRLQV